MNIERAIANADKILAVLSDNSRDRDWPRLSGQLAEEVEAQLGSPVLVTYAWMIRPFQATTRHDCNSCEGLED